jgi:hypothetical protein
MCKGVPIELVNELLAGCPPLNYRSHQNLAALSVVSVTLSKQLQTQRQWRCSQAFRRRCCAYLKDLAHFEAWGGQLPAGPTTVASYIVAHAETLSVATLVRRMATMRPWAT